MRAAARGREREAPLWLGRTGIQGRWISGGLVLVAAMIASLFCGLVAQAYSAAPVALGVSPAFRSIVNSGSSVTLSWPSPSAETYPGIEVNGLGLVITEDSGFFEGVPPHKGQIIVIPIKPGQTSLTLPYSLPAGVALYWAVDEYLAPQGEISHFPVVGDDGSPFVFGVANPATAHNAKRYIGRVIEYYVNHPARFEPMVKCGRPSNGHMSCRFKGRDSGEDVTGRATLSTGGSTFVNVTISGTLTGTFGAPGEGEHTIRTPITLRDKEVAQVCSSGGLPVYPPGTTKWEGVNVEGPSFFCNPIETPLGA